jgi:hypothetical protein
MKKIKKSTKKKSRKGTFLDKTKKLIAIFAALAYDKHLDYDVDDGLNTENRKKDE